LQKINKLPKDLNLIIIKFLLVLICQWSTEKIREADNNIKQLLSYRLGANLSEEDKKKLPPSLGVLLTGTHHSGKSSTVNTLLRILNQEWDTPYGLHKKHAEVTARGGHHGTSRYDVYKPNTGIFIFYDCPGIVENNRDTYPDLVEKCLTEGMKTGKLTSRDGKMITSISTTDLQWNKYGNMCSAAILVLCKEDLTDKSIRNLLSSREFLESWRKEDRLPLVVITGKTEITKWKPETEIQKDISDLIGVTNVFWLDNPTNYKDRPCDKCSTPQNFHYCGNTRNLANEWQVYLLLKWIYDSTEQRFKAKLSESK